VHIVSIGKPGDEAVVAAERLYDQLAESGVETILDDRDAGPGEKLTDAELLGCPLRITVGRRALADGVVEAQVRSTGAEHRLAVDEASDEAAKLLAGLD
jgi:prolyl-tRNA synthetase